jgi:hypothetical protein
MTPIYQMTFESKDSLVFSVETDEFNTLVYALPIRQNNKFWSDVYYLPGEIDGKYKDFKLTFEEGVFVIKDVTINTIRFGIGKLPLKYIGKHQQIVNPYERFIQLYPIDILIMDNAYLQHKAFFVGLTPMFGEKNK